MHPVSVLVINVVGNSSQISDGAAAVLLARRSYARKNNLPILGVFRSYAVVGVPPEIMGVGPAYAIPEALNRIGTVLCSFVVSYKWVVIRQKTNNSESN